MPSNRLWLSQTLGGCDEVARTCRRYREVVAKEKHKERGCSGEKVHAGWRRRNRKKGRKKENKSKKEQLLKMLS